MTDQLKKQPRKTDPVRLITAIMLLSAFACIVWIASVGLPSAGVTSPWIQVPLLVFVSTCIIMAPCGAIFAAGLLAVHQSFLARVWAHYYLLFAELARLMIKNDLGMSRVAKSAIATSYLEEGRFTDANQIIDQLAQEEEEGMLTNDVIYGLLAQVKTFTGRKKDALEYLDRARDLSERNWNDVPDELRFPALGEFYSNAGACLIDLGETEMAIDSLRTSLSYREKFNGGDSDEVSRTLNNLGYALYKANELEEAMRVLERGKKIRETLGKTRDYFYASLINNIGLVLHATGKDDEALNMLIAATKLPSYSPLDAGFRLCSVGHFYFDREQYREAARYFSKSLRLWSRMQGYNHPDYLLCLERYQRSLLALNKLNEAKKVSTAIVDLQQGKELASNAIPLVE